MDTLLENPILFVLIYLGIGLLYSMARHMYLGIPILNCKRLSNALQDIMGHLFMSLIWPIHLIIGLLKYADVFDLFT